MGNRNLKDNKQLNMVVKKKQVHLRALPKRNNRTENDTFNEDYFLNKV